MDILQQLSATPVTMALVAGISICGILATMDVVRPLQMIYSPTLVFEQKQYWRLLTSFLFVGPLSINCLLGLQWMYIVSSTIEEQYFHRNTFDYVFVLLVGCAFLVGLRSMNVIEVPFLSFIFSNMLVYLYSRLSPNQRIDLVGLFVIPTNILPFLYLAMTIVVQGMDNARDYIVGCLIGHMLWYLLEIFPRITGIKLLRIQERLERLLAWAA